MVNDDQGKDEDKKESDKDTDLTEEQKKEELKKLEKKRGQISDKGSEFDDVDKEARKILLEDIKVSDGKYIVDPPKEEKPKAEPNEIPEDE